TIKTAEYRFGAPETATRQHGFAAIIGAGNVVGGIRNLVRRNAQAEAGDVASVHRILRGGLPLEAPMGSNGARTMPQASVINASAASEVNCPSQRAISARY